jgi:hypothetical protein
VTEKSHSRHDDQEVDPAETGRSQGAPSTPLPPTGPRLPQFESMGGLTID